MTDKKLKEMQALKAKKEFYSKHMTKYMGDIMPLSLDTIEKLPVEKRGTQVLSPDLTTFKGSSLLDKDQGANGVFNRKKSVNDTVGGRYQNKDASTIKMTDDLLKFVRNKNLNYFSPL